MSDVDEDQEKSFIAEIAKTGRAICKKCKNKCDAAILRIGKVMPSPFGSGFMKNWYHVDCLFESFQTQRQGTKKIETIDDIGGWSNLGESDKDILLEKLNVQSHKTTTKSPKTPTISTYIKSSDDKKDNAFKLFRNMCMKLSEESSYNEKTMILKKFFLNESGKKFEGDIYLWIKFLLPGSIKRIYNLQNKQLIKLFSKIFNADHQEMLSDLERGDIADTIRLFFLQSKTIKPKDKSTITMIEVDSFLEKLSHMTREEEQINLFQEICKLSSSNDLKMIIHMIKHDLRINAGPKHILDSLNHDAYPAYQLSRDLKQVVERFANNITKDLVSPQKAKLNKSDVGIQIMSPVSPMLAEACKSVEKAIAKYPQGMLGEIKYDGERVQLHKHGDEFKFFSRNLKPVLDHKIHRCKEFIPKAFPNAFDLILDSEIIVVDTKTGELLPFGTLGVHKKTQYKSAEVCLFIFDCIYYNGEDLTKKSMKVRREILKKNIIPIKNHVELSKQKFINNTKDLSSLLSTVLHKGLEGLVLKDINGIYEPGKRHWLKMKKDYLFDGKMADAADLLVLGGWFGTGKKGGKISIFLMGCLDEKLNKWKTVTKVATGLDDSTLDKLQDALKPLVKRSDSDNMPNWLDCKKSMLPDLIAIDPKTMPVWEIVGAEFSRADIHTAEGISIRFPRIAQLRDDKTHENATNLTELKTLFKNSKDSVDLKLLGGDNKEDIWNDDDETINDATVLTTDGIGATKKKLETVKNIKTKDNIKSTLNIPRTPRKEVKAITPSTIKTDTIDDGKSKIKRKSSETESSFSEEKPLKKMKTQFKNEEVCDDDNKDDTKVILNLKNLTEPTSCIKEETTANGKDTAAIFNNVKLFIENNNKEIMETLSEELKMFKLWGGTVVDESFKSSHAIHESSNTTIDLKTLRKMYKPICRHVQIDWLKESIEIKALASIMKYPVFIVEYK